MFFLYMTKIHLFSPSIFILFVLFCIPGTCVFYNWKKNFFLHSWSNNQLSCSILSKIFTMRAVDYERIINYDWSYEHTVAPTCFKSRHIKFWCPDFFHNELCLMSGLKSSLSDAPSWLPDNLPGLKKIIFRPDIQLF